MVRPGFSGTVLELLEGYWLGGGAGAGLYSSWPRVTGTTRANSSTVHLPSLEMVFTTSGSFCKDTNPSLT